MSSPLEKIIESKRALRRELIALAIGQKLRILDALRAREDQVRLSATAADGLAVSKLPRR